MKLSILIVLVISVELLATSLTTVYKNSATNQATNQTIVTSPTLEVETATITESAVVKKPEVEFMKANLPEGDFDFLFIKIDREFVSIELAEELKDSYIDLMDFILSQIEDFDFIKNQKHLLNIENKSTIIKGSQCKIPPQEITLLTHLVPRQIQIQTMDVRGQVKTSEELKKIMDSNNLISKYYDLIREYLVGEKGKSSYVKSKFMALKNKVNELILLYPDCSELTYKLYNQIIISYSKEVILKYVKLFIYYSKNAKYYGAEFSEDILPKITRLREIGNVLSQNGFDVNSEINNQLLLNFSELRIRDNCVGIHGPCFEP